ncbi:MAG: PAS domain-containing sensor histidine kinase [Acidimicrobiia bacterium]
MTTESPADVVVVADDVRAALLDRISQELATQRQLLDNSPDGVVLCDADGTIVLANRRLEELLGYGRGALIGQSLELLVPEARRTAHRDYRHSYQDAPRVRAMAPALDLAARCADGTEIAVEIALAPLVFDGRTVTMATVRDARERLAHLAQLHAAQQRLALAEERERIARDLHDIVIQRLFATGMSIQAVAMRCSDAVRPRLDGAVDAIDEAIRDIRSSIFQLSHAAARQGVRAGLFDLAAEAERLVGFLPRVHFDGPVDSALDGELGGEVLSVVRELVSNAVRHAQPTELHISVFVERDRVRALVEDNGVGLPDGDGPRAGRGLANLAERARRRSGTFTLENRPAGGTVATWTAELS